MTRHDLVRLVARRWYVYAAFLAAAVLSVFLLCLMPRVYTTRATIEFSPPTTVTSTVPYHDYAESMISFTGVVEHVYNDRYRSISLTSPTASLFGNGIRQGVSVEVSKTGNQWVQSFDRPVIEVSISGRDAQDVLATVDSVAHRVERIAAGLQAEVDVPETDLIATSLNEGAIGIDSFDATSAGRYMGGAALIMAALVLATVVSRGLESIAARHRGRP